MRDSSDNIRNAVPGRSERAAAWQTAIGLQAADGLSTSEFLLQTSQKHVSGKISIDEVRQLVDDYYFERNANDAGDPEKENADRTSVNIVRILLSGALDFSINGLVGLNRSIFDGVYDNAGSLRVFEVTKREWVLGGDTVSFIGVDDLHGALERCIAKERDYRYDAVSADSLISHLAALVSQIWQICPFGEGNTRFTAVFTLLYLRYLGINFKFDTFKNDSWYFHNALVRANYRDIVKNIDYEPVYLERFFRNMLLGEQWDLRNRYVHVRPAAEWSVQSNSNSGTRTVQVKVKHGTSKVKENSKKRTSKVEDIIETKAPEIEAKSPEKAENVSKTNENYQDNPNILFLAVVIGEKFLSVREIMEGLHLKGRDSFLKLYLGPAVKCGLVSLLYPNSPKHPRQKYLLTQKGLDFLAETGPEMVGRIERHLASK